MVTEIYIHPKYQGSPITYNYAIAKIETKKKSKGQFYLEAQQDSFHGVMTSQGMKGEFECSF